MPRRNPVTTCKAKARYLDSDTAEKARIEKQAKYGRNLSLYLCRYCRNWHLTSKYR
jgi:hypothetical protein